MDQKHPLQLSHELLLHRKIFFIYSLLFIISIFLTSVDYILVLKRQLDNWVLKWQEPEQFWGSKELK